MQRKLASVQQVKDVMPIYHPKDGTLTGLDLITFEDIAWQCVASRNEFSPGELAIYIEISTVAPEHPVFEFLRNKKFKIKTIRLCGALSQGLAIPLYRLDEFYPAMGDLATFKVGDDVTELIGVTRYEAPIDVKINGGGAVRTFPEDVCPRTDEIRIQSMPHILDAFDGKGVVATRKEDGTSATYFWDVELDKIRVCSRNMEKMEKDDSVYWRVLELNPFIENFLKRYPDFVLQGEITAPGIQKNRLGRTEPTFHAFNMFDRPTGNYVPHSAATLIASINNIPWVETVKVWEKFEDETVESLLELAKGNYPGTNNAQEGIVLRLLYEDRHSYVLGGRISCKVINNDYLEGGGE